MVKFPEQVISSDIFGDKLRDDEVFIIWVGLKVASWISFLQIKLIENIW